MNTSILKSIAAVIVAIGIAPVMEARQVSVAEAMSNAGLTYGSGRSRSTTDSDTYRLVHTESVGDLNTLYILNKNDKGYVILSADDVALPLIGYSDESTVEPMTIPESLEWWLGYCSRQIAAAATESSQPYTAQADDAVKDYKPIDPILPCKWNQGYPYYNDLPEFNGVHSFTGCQITAVTQVMYYHKWPKVGTGRFKYTYQGTGHMVNLANEPFDWDNMLGEYCEKPADARLYQTEEQEQAVAHLMYVMGVGNQANWGTGGTSADPLLTFKILTDNLGYDAESINLLMRDSFDDATWTDIMYNELCDNGPVLLEGSNSKGGHAFVCDGYDKDGYFHINWGWGGLSDGWYKFHGLVPGQQGIGGSSGGYNDYLRATIGIRPPRENAERSIYVCMTSDFNTSKDTYDVKSDADELIQLMPNSTTLGKISVRVKLPTTLRMGVRLTDEGGKETYVWGCVNTTGSYSDTYYCGECGWGPAAYYIKKSDLPASGIYTVTPVALYNDKILDIYVSPGRISKLRLEADGESMKFITDTEMPSLEITDIEQLTDFLVGESCRFSVTVINSGADYIGGLQPKLRNSSGDDNCGQLKSRTVNIARGETQTFIFTGTFENVTAGDYMLYFSDAAANGRESKIDGKELPVTFLENVTHDIRLESFEIENSGTRSVIHNNIARTAYNVSRNFSAKARLTSAVHYDYRLYALFYPVENPVNYDDQIKFTTTLRKDGVNEIAYEGDMSKLASGKFYYIMLLYGMDSSRTYYVKDSKGTNPYYYVYVNENASGIEVVEADKGCRISIAPSGSTAEVMCDAPISSLTVYNLSGNILRQCDGNGEPHMTLDVSGLQSGHYIIKADTANGPRVTKFIR